MHLNYTKTSLTVGLFLGGWHVLWSLLVFTGLAQPLWDLLLWAHMIHLTLIIGPFDATAAVSLVAITFFTGCMFGWAFAYIWNAMHKN